MFGNLFSSGSTAKDTQGTKVLKELLESMTRSLVDEPDKIQLDQVGEEDDLLQFELRVSKNDLGKVIGKKGRTASAMRTILSAASRKFRVGADLKIVE